MAARDELKKGLKLFRDFNASDPEYLDEIEIPVYTHLVSIGPCISVAYAARDGHDYRHTFRARSRPELCVTPDGKHLTFAGGSYEFTDRGIVDR